MKIFIYVMRDATSGRKLMAGTVRAETMELASVQAMKSCGVTIRQVKGEYYTDTDFIRGGSKVYLYLGIHPEHFLDSGVPVFD